MGMTIINSQIATPTNQAPRGRLLPVMLEDPTRVAGQWEGAKEGFNQMVGAGVKMIGAGQALYKKEIDAAVTDRMNQIDLAMMKTEAWYSTLTGKEAMEGYGTLMSERQALYDQYSGFTDPNMSRAFNERYTKSMKARQLQYQRKYIQESMNYQMNTLGEEEAIDFNSVMQSLSPNGGGIADSANNTVIAPVISPEAGGAFGETTPLGGGTQVSFQPMQATQATLVATDGTVLPPVLPGTIIDEAVQRSNARIDQIYGGIAPPLVVENFKTDREAVIYSMVAQRYTQTNQLDMAEAFLDNPRVKEIMRNGKDPKAWFNARMGIVNQRAANSAEQRLDAEGRAALVDLEQGGGTREDRVKAAIRNGATASQAERMYPKEVYAYAEKMVDFKASYRERLANGTAPEVLAAEAERTGHQKEYREALVAHTESGDSSYKPGEAAEYLFNDPQSVVVIALSRGDAAGALNAVASLEREKVISESDAAYLTSRIANTDAYRNMETPEEGLANARRQRLSADAAQNIKLLNNYRQMEGALKSGTRLEQLDAFRNATPADQAVMRDLARSDANRTQSTFARENAYYAQYIAGDHGTPEEVLGNAEALKLAYSRIGQSGVQRLMEAKDHPDGYGDKYIFDQIGVKLGAQYAAAGRVGNDQGVPGVTDAGNLNGYARVAQDKATEYATTALRDYLLENKVGFKDVPKATVDGIIEKALIAAQIDTSLDAFRKEAVIAVPDNTPGLQTVKEVDTFIDTTSHGANGVTPGGGVSRGFAEDIAPFVMDAITPGVGSQSPRYVMYNVDGERRVVRELPNWNDKYATGDNLVVRGVVERAYQKRGIYFDRNVDVTRVYLDPVTQFLYIDPDDDSLPIMREMYAVDPKAPEPTKLQKYKQTGRID